jgi:hypothetical protein
MQGQLTRRARGEDGQASVEFLGALPLLVIAALLVWQLMLFGTVMTDAQNAARTGSRAASLHSDGTKAAYNALRPSFRDHAQVTTQPDGTVRVKVKVPLLVPSIPLPVSITEAATIPSAS